MPEKKSCLERGIHFIVIKKIILPQVHCSLTVLFML